LMDCSTSYRSNTSIMELALGKQDNWDWTKFIAKSPNVRHNLTFIDCNNAMHSISYSIREYTSSLLISIDLTKLSLPTSRIQITGSALEHWHIMHCSQFNVSFRLFGLEGESFKGLPNDAIIRNMNVSVRLNSGTTIT
jgi:hypothetical protein